MNNQEKPSIHNLWFYFCQTYDLLNGYRQGLHLRSNVTNEQLHVLWNIKYMKEINSEPVILSKLANQLMRNINSASELINRMEKAGLIEKNKVLSDKRVIQIELTEKGEKIFRDNAKTYLDFVERLFSPLNDRDIKSFLRLMKKLCKLIHQDFNPNQFASDPLLNDPANIDLFVKKLKSLL